MKEDIRPDLSHLYPSSTGQNGLRSHLNSSRNGGFFAPNFWTERAWAGIVTLPSTTGAAIARSAEALYEDPAN
eukprot:4108868-Pleurochrysis_carterae.AAC.1